MSSKSSLSVFWKSLIQLRTSELLHLAAYRAGLKLNVISIPAPGEARGLMLKEPAIISQALIDWHADPDDDFLEVANRICNGEYPLFGGPFQKLDLDHHSPMKSWREYELRRVKPSQVDIKQIWEPARFGWAVFLAAAYKKTGDQKYLACFSGLLEEFLAHNPPYLGPNWTSGQECAIRIISLAYCVQLLFRQVEPETDLRLKLTTFLIANARRIPPTLSYARAQNNNHLLIEAAGLITSASMFEDSRETRKWSRTGWRIFCRCITRQFSNDGEYIQHSSNYHRLALQAIAWILAIAKDKRKELPGAVHEKIRRAVHWLEERTDAKSGLTPNYGHNDGSYLIPLSTSFQDYRPVLGLFSSDSKKKTTIEPNNCFIICDSNSWAHVRINQFRSRPAHADQLHVDLWHAGQPITLDAGTYTYNMPYPWDNRLTSTRVHNTISINNADQMLRAGKFLWLDWAQAKTIGSPEQDHVVAVHDGYKKLGFVHQRRLMKDRENKWTVEDTIMRSRQKPGNYHLNLQWLIPDVPYRLGPAELTADFGLFQVSISLTVRQGPSPSFSIVRAGKTILGSITPQPGMGWYSPTYLQKIPALSLNWSIVTGMPVELATRFTIHSFTSLLV